MFDSVVPIPWAESQLWSPKESAEANMHSAPMFVQQGDTEHLRAGSGPASVIPACEVLAGAHRPA